MPICLDCGTSLFDGQFECPICADRRYREWTEDFRKKQQLDNEKRAQAAQEKYDRKEEAKRIAREKAAAKPSSKKKETITDSENNPESVFLSKIPLLSAIIGAVTGGLVFIQSNDVGLGIAGLLAGGIASAISLNILYHIMVAIVEVVTELAKFAIKLAAAGLVILLIGLWFDASWAHGVLRLVVR